MELTEYNLCKGDFNNYKALYGIPPWRGMPYKTIMMWDKINEIVYNLSKPKVKKDGNDQQQTHNNNRYQR